MRRLTHTRRLSFSYALYARWVFWVLAVLLLPHVVWAHGFEPALVDVRETKPGLFHVHWKTPPVDATGSESTTLELPAWCHRVGAVTAGFNDDLWYDCGDRGLRSARVSVNFPPVVQHEVILRIVDVHGRSFSTVLRAATPSADLPFSITTASRWHTWRSYVGLGLRHVAQGWDHLLFLVALAVWVRNIRGALIALSAFTLGHSFTLALTVLGTIVLPSSVVEAWIAGTIFLLVVSIVTTRNDPRPTLLEAATMAGLCGLVHGMGFAAGLTEIGLPVGMVPLALTGFNVGVELAQLAWTLGMLPFVWLARRTSDRVREASWWTMVYVQGAISCALLISRVATVCT